MAPKTKQFEGVKIMQTIKAKMSLKNANNRELFFKDMEAISKKYNLKGPKRKKITLSE